MLWYLEELPQVYLWHILKRNCLIVLAVVQINGKKRDSEYIDHSLKIGLSLSKTLWCYLLQRKPLKSDLKFIYIIHAKHTSDRKQNDSIEILSRYQWNRW